MWQKIVENLLIFVYLFCPKNGTIDFTKTFITQEWLVVENYPIPRWITFLMLYLLVQNVRSHFNELILAWCAYIEAWKWLFLLLKPKWYLDIKLVAFSQFSSNENRKQWVLFYLQSFLLIYGISGFSFFVIEDIRKPGNHGRFSEAHF